MPSIGRAWPQPPDDAEPRRHRLLQQRAAAGEQRFLLQRAARDRADRRAACRRRIPAARCQ